MNSNDISAISEAVAVDQIILRALLAEFVRQSVQTSDEPERAKRDLLNRLYETIDSHCVPGASEDVLDDFREKARGNIDALLASLPPR